MTGGLGLVLGPVGPVVGSGMTGGAIWLLDEDGRAEKHLHAESVQIVPPDEGDLDRVRVLAAEHAERTASPRIRALLADWSRTAARLVKVVPRPPAA